MSASPHHRSFRRVLAVSTALGGFLALPVAAQTIALPTDASIQDVHLSPLGSNPQLSLSNNDTRLNINLRAQTTVIDWQGFNIPVDHTINFSNGRVVPGAAAVLNRDVSTNPSQLLGNLTSARDVSVWVYNGNGILVGSKSVFNTGSLVLSTLDISPADFIASSNSFRLRAATGTEQSAITIANGAKITVDGETRGLVMVAPKIDANGEFVAKGQDVAFVAASDVTMAYGAGSPLSVTINRGTAVVGPSQVVQGKVEGNNVLFALASQDTITNALLQVNADVTSVSAGSRGIVLSAGRTNNVAGVTLGSDAAATGGIVATSIDGTLKTLGNNSNVVLAATGAASVQGAIETRGDATITAGGALAMTGSITALDDVRLTGAGIAFGGAISPDLAETSITAADQVQLVSTGGTITATGPLLLQSGASGDDSLAIETRGTAGGDILLGRDSSLIAGSDGRGALSLRLRDGANAVSLGDVTARGIRSAVGTAAMANGLRTTGLVSIGNVSVRDTLAIDAGGITGGAMLSDGAITLESANAITVDGLDARSGSTTATATGAITVRALARANGAQSDLVIDTVGDVSVGIASAGRDVLIGSAAPAATVAIPGVVSAGRTYRINANAILLGNGQAVQQSANGGITLTSGSGGITGLAGLTLVADAGGGSNGMTLAIDAVRAAGVGGAIDFAPSTRLLGGGGRTSDIRIRSADAAGIVALGNVSARNLLGAVASEAYATGVTRTGALRTGDVAVRGDLLLSGASVVTGRLDSDASIDLVATTDAISTGRLGAGDAITATAAGALFVSGDVLANDDITLGGASVTLGGTAMRGGGSIDVLARGGGILSTQALAIESTSTNSGDFIRLGAAGPEGIVLGAGSAITNTNRVIGVRIFTAADAPLVLGDVVARSLGTLTAIDGDPLAAGGAFRSQGSLSFGRLNLVQGFAAESVAGDLSVEAIAVTGSGQGIDLRAGAGTLSVPSNLSASGAVTLISGNALTLGVVESRDAALLLSSGGVLTTGALRGATGVTASGASATLGAVSGGTGAVGLTASGGDLSFAGAQGSAITLMASNGAIDAGGALTASAGAISAAAGGAITANGGVTATGGGVSLVSTGGALSAAGGVRAGGDVTLAGTAITLGGVNQARGSYTATASAGGIVRAGDGGSIRSDSDGSGGEGISLTASGGAIALADTLLSAGAGAVSLTTTGGGIAVGAVDAASLSAIGATNDGATIRTGDLTLATGLGLSAAGAVRTGAISVTNGAVTVASGAGDVTTGAITATGTAALSGAAVTFGDVTAAGLTAQASTGAISGGAITSVGDVQVGAAGAVTLGRVTSSTGSVVIAGAGPITVTRVKAGGAATVTGSVLDADVVITEGVDAVGAATVRSGGDIRTPFVISRTSDLTVAAPNGRVAGLQPNSGTDLQAGPGGAFSLTVGDDAELGNVSGGNISITATSIIAGSIAGGNEAVTLRATAGDLRVTGPVTGSDVSLTSVGNTRLGSVDASGAVTIGGDDSLSFGTVSGTSITATGGVVTGVALRSPGTIDLRAAAVTLNAVEAGTLLADASNGLAIDSVVTTGDATLGSGAAMGLGTVSAGGTLTVDAGTTLGFTTLSGASIDAAGATIDGGALNAAGSIDLSGTDVTVSAVDANTLTATIVNGLALGTVRTTGSATLVSGGAMGLDTVAAGGALTVDAGTTLGFTALSGASIDVAGATINGGALNAAGAIDLSGTDVRVGTIGANMLTATAMNGLAFDAVTVVGDVTLKSGTADLGTVSAGGALAIDTTGGLTFDRLAGNSVVVSGGTVRGDAIDADAAVSVRGTTVQVGSVDAGRGFTAKADDAVAIGTIAAGGDVMVGAGNAATVGGASVGGAYQVTGGTIVLGGAQQAAGAVRIVATLGAVRGSEGLTLASGAAMVLDGAGGLSLGGTTLRANGALGLRAGSGNAIRLGSVEAASIGGFDGTAITDRVTHDASFDAGDVTAGPIAITLSAGDLTLGRVIGRGAVSLAAQSVRTGALDAASLDAKATNGLTLGTTTVGGNAALTGGSITTPSVTAGAITMSTAGSLGDVNGGRTAVRTISGDLTVDAGSARLATVDSAGAATLRVGTIDVSVRLAAARQLLVAARSALTLGDASAGGEMSLKSADAVTTGALTAAGKLAVEGTAITLGSAAAAGGIALDASGLVRSGALSGGPSVTVRGADVELSGAVRATDVRFATRDPATSTLRIGDGTAAGGFRLSASEIGLIAADTLGFDAGSGAMEIGTMALTPTIAKSVAMLSTGEVRVTGQLSSSGGAQAIRIGGDAAQGNAQTIHVVATSDAGGRIYAEGADVELRGNRIAVGLAPGFIDTLQPGDAGIAQAAALIGNANSALYNPLLGGAVYSPDATTTLAARSLTVRFGDYALFQNTGIPGSTSAVTLGSLAMPVLPALRVSTFGSPATASFALFGTINGISGASTALLGNPVIEIDPLLLANSRINGCLARSGAGCLTTIVIQPTLQVFNWNSEAVFGIRQDVSLPFSPIISGNNEELLGELPELAPEQLETTSPAAQPTAQSDAQPQEPKP